jgi:hypothetical protein
MTLANLDITPRETPAASTSQTSVLAATTVVNGLVAQWTFDEGAGAYAADSSGNSHNGTLVNFPLWTAGRSGGALQFNRMNQVNAPDDAHFSFTNGSSDQSFSVALWINSDDSYLGNLIGHFEPPHNRQWRLGARKDNPSSIYLILFDENASAQIARSVSYNFSPGQWHHLVATYNGSRSGDGMTFYIDGQPKSQNAIADSGGYGAMRTVAAPLEIGAFGGTERNFAGKLDDVRVYNRELAASEVLDIFNEAGNLPLISSIAVTGIDDTSATISWTTDKDTDSIVEYGVTTMYGASTSAGLGVPHSLNLPNLTQNTLYHYRVTSKDAAGHTATSGDLTFATQPTNVATPAQFYVSPNGDDSNPGMIDAPFRTIPRAQAAVRSITSAVSGDITVYLREGTYFISNPLVFDIRDSGTNSHNVIWTSYSGEHPTISGGQTIQGPWTAEGGGIYSAAVSGLGFRQLYINGVAGVRARTPNADALTPYYSLKDWSTENGGVRIGTKIDCEAIYEQYPIVDSRNIQQVAYPHEVEFVNNLYYTQLRFHIAALDNSANNGTTKVIPQEATIVFGGHSNHKKDLTLPDLPVPYIPNPYYYFENAKEFLDTPGEWYLDSHVHKVFYMPRAGETLSTAIVTAPVVERLLQIQGAGSSSVIQNIQFKGITFENSN